MTDFPETGAVLADGTVKGEEANLHEVTEGMVMGILLGVCITCFVLGFILARLI